MMATPNMNASPTADLSQLKDIHLPDAISDWPLAFGWWTLLILTILSLCVIVYFWRRYRVNNANKKAALQLLRLKYQRFKADSDSQAFLRHSNQILKRYCLQQYPAAVSLSGLAWTDFLILHSAKTAFSKELTYAMSEGLYQQNCKYDADELYNACSGWLKNNQQVTADVALEHSKGHSTGHAND
jgi:cbb3-type cytochrome oxidase subunit 3